MTSYKDNYTLTLKPGTQKTIDLSKYGEGAYNRLRQRVSVHQKNTGETLITRKTGSKVLIYRVK